jgi:ABC-type cobalamin/Fe3+-siderophores transport system ATPase subunit
VNIWDDLARVIIAGEPFTADDVTDCGNRAVDPAHRSNGAQSAIGKVFQQAQSNGWIESTNRVVRSSAPHRKGGGIRVWRPTQAGIDWAMEQYAAEHIRSSLRRHPSNGEQRLFEIDMEADG